MEGIIFDGQQTDERVLYEIAPHQYAKYTSIIKIVLLSIFFYIVINLISTVYAPATVFLQLVGLLFSAAVLIIGLWWIQTVYTKAKTYITDRRIIRFEVSTPFVTAKRALFWNEALKAKGYPPNLFYKMLNIGIVRVEPQMDSSEDVIVTDVFMYGDVANYIDKILFTFKNKPADIADIRPFVPKPRGQRD